METVSPWVAKPLEGTEKARAEMIVEFYRKCGFNEKTKLTEIEDFGRSLSMLNYRDEGSPQTELILALLKGRGPEDVVQMYLTGEPVPWEWRPHFSSEEQRQLFIQELRPNAIPLQAVIDSIPKYHKPDPLMEAARSRMGNQNVEGLLQFASGIVDRIIPQPDPEPAAIPKDAMLCTNMRPEGLEWPQVTTEYTEFTPTQFRQLANLRGAVGDLNVQKVVGDHLHMFGLPRNLLDTNDKVDRAELRKQMEGVMDGSISLLLNEAKEITAPDGKKSYIGFLNLDPKPGEAQPHVEMNLRKNKDGTFEFLGTSMVCPPDSLFNKIKAISVDPFFEPMVSLAERLAGNKDTTFGHHVSTDVNVTGFKPSAQEDALIQQPAAGMVLLDVSHYLTTREYVNRVLAHIPRLGAFIRHDGSLRVTYTQHEAPMVDKLIAEESKGSCRLLYTKPAAIPARLIKRYGPIETNEPLLDIPVQEVNTDALNAKGFYPNNKSG